MKFNPFEWKEVKPHEENIYEKGLLVLRCSQAGALYLAAQGCEALVGVGTAFDVQTSEQVTWRFDAPKGARVFMRVPERSAVEPEGEVYTNIDRMPDESGSVAEVTRALRQFELERRAGLRELRAEREAIRAERESLVEKPVADPVPLSEPESEVKA